MVYFHWKSAFWVRPCLKTSLWRHTLTAFHDFGINGKKRPYPIPWNQTIILWARQFQVHNPLGKPCYKKRLGRMRVKESIYIRINQPTLNKDGGGYKLPNVYDPVLTSLLKVSNSREIGHSADESCSESNWKFQVHNFIELWSKVWFIHFLNASFKVYLSLILFISEIWFFRLSWKRRLPVWYFCFFDFNLFQLVLECFEGIPFRQEMNYKRSVAGLLLML